MKSNYYLGLDIGTTSCGYAVTDENYNLLKLKGKKVWGVKLFDEAETAQIRRQQRCNRRRIARKKLKIKWLNEIFEEEIGKIDKNFLNRLKYSNLWEEDKYLMNDSLNSKDSLFNDNINGEKYTDKNFYNEYPTIYHLRKELTTEPAKDVRFLYLAIHNIIKRRGHFLYEGDYGENNKLTLIINQLLELLNNFFAENVQPINVNLVNNNVENEIINIIKNTSGVRESKKLLHEIFKVDNKQFNKFIDVFIDGKVNLKDLFNLSETYKFSFDDEDYENTILSNLETMLNDSQLEIINNLKMIYSTLQLKKILGENNYLCESMVNIFETHKAQLKHFKKFIKKYYLSYYNDIFRNLNLKNNTNYATYVNGNLVDGKKQVIGLINSDRTRESFYKYIKKILAENPTITSFNKEEFETERSKILNEIENNNFLLKQRSKSNSIFPNKLYVKELKQILNVNSKKFGFLLKKDESGLTNMERILQILEFRIPYFVGPVGENENAESVFGWSKKEKNEDIKPWTIQNIINFDKSEDAFIQKMTNKCSYLKDKDVLPKKSLLYSKFVVLNELNNLKINGNPISVELKQSIFNNLFKLNKKVTTKQLKDFLVAQAIYSEEEIKNINITGIDKEFANNYSTYVNFVNIFGENFVENNVDLIEKIIKYHTIISDKNRLKKRLEKEFGAVISFEQIKSILGLSFSDWGRLSKEFLNGLKFVDLETGEITTIIDQMWETNQNLQELLFNKKYTIEQELSKIQVKMNEDLTYQDVMELYCSPAVKRGVWQTIKIVKEIVNLMGKEPDKIFVEVTRQDEEKGDNGRKLSRKTNLLSMYQSAEFKNALTFMHNDLTNLTKNLEDVENNALRSERLYLYYLQLGKCAYSGEPIDITKIYDQNYYDVDHIVPQSIIKDDSIENKVLVKNQYNKEKSDNYPISSIHPEWVEKQKPFWEQLVKLKLMSSSKFSKLVRTNELSNDEIGGFIARQLVETNQSVLAVINLLKRMVDNPRKVVYSKAKYVSEFRNQFNIPKCREINNLHHAQDAYLNIVVGNVLFNRFTDDPRNFYKKENKNKNITKNIKKLFNCEIKKYNSDQIVWKGENDILKVKNICEKQDCVVAHMNYVNSNDAFYDETVYKSLKNNPKTKAKICLKGNINNPLNNFEKYGGYNNFSSAYFMVVESEDKKGNKLKTIVTVPVYIERKFKNDLNKQQKILEYVATENKLINPKILMPKLKIKSTLIINGAKYLLAGKSGETYILHNANEWFVNAETTNYIKTIVKYMDLKKNKKDSDLTEENGAVIVSKASKAGNTEKVLTKQQNEELYNAIIMQLNKKLYENSQLSDGLNNKLKLYFNNFKNLSVLQQTELLYKVICRVSPGATAADLTLLGDSANVAVITIGKNITNKKIKLLKQSASGLINKTISL